MIHFTIGQVAGEGRSYPGEIRFQPISLVIAGWTGRHRESVEAHIVELEAIGIARPKSVPIYYRAGASLVTTASVIQVVGREGSGEAEAVLVKHGGHLYVGVGSDHTDRKLEAVGITLSKQVCPKPVSQLLWPWEEVADHWDDLILRSLVQGEGKVYQQGSVSALQRPHELLAQYEQREGVLPDGSVMFCGTLPVEGGIRFEAGLVLELEDPIRNRKIRHEYWVETLPIAEA